MSIASRIEQIEEHIGDIYDTVEITGVDTSQIDKNLVNVPKQLKLGLVDTINNGTDTLYENFPKVSGSGSDISLENTYESKMKIDMGGDTEQNGTPSPDFPQNIEVVTGLQDVDIVGKNLLNLPNGTYSHNGVTANVNNGTITLNGTANGTSFINIPISLTLVGNENYVLSSNNNQTIGGNDSEPYACIRLSTSNSDDTETNVLFNIQNNSRVINKTSNINYINFKIRTATNLKFEDFIIYPQLEKSSQATTYKAFESQNYQINLGSMELCKIGDYRDRIKKSTGKNLWGGFASDFLRTNNGVDFINNKDGSITADGTASPNALSLNNTQASSNNHYITLQAGTYTLSGANANCRLLVSDMNGNNITTTTTTDFYKTFTLDEAQECFIRMQVNSGTTVNNETIYPMLVKGDTALPYEPYGTDWYIKKEIGKVVLDGSESSSNWIKITSSNNTIFAYKGITDITTSLNSQIGLLLSDKFTPTSWNTLTGTDLIGISNNVTITNGAIRLGFGLSSSITDVDLLKTWLSTHNTTVYYVLANPTYTTITETDYQELYNQLLSFQNAMSYNEQTNISVQGNLPSLLEVVALGDGE